jgi:polyisoprenyl-phosphate glycosyltransferase
MSTGSNNSTARLGSGTLGPAKLSLVIPVFNEEENLPEIFKRLRPVEAVVATRGISVEIVIVDDHSGDSTPRVAKSLAAAGSNVRYLRLSRNSGAHLACAAGLEHCAGDAAIILAADLQDPPEIVPELAAEWRAGYDVVWAARAGREGESWVTLLTSRLFNWLMRASFRDLPPHGADVFLVSRRVIDAYNRMREKNTNINLAIRWLGFRQTTIPYVKQARHAGRSRFTLAKKIKVFIDSVVGYSYLPLRVISVLGVILILFGLLGGVAALAGGLFAGFAASLWLAMILGVFSIGQGAALVALGILGEYVWRALDESRGRPRYVIEESVGPFEESCTRADATCETGLAQSTPVTQSETWAGT